MSDMLDYGTGYRDNKSRESNAVFVMRETSYEPVFLF